MTAVVETGNHIAQIGEGTARRLCAERLVAMLGQVIVGQAPWQLNEVRWGREFLAALINGSPSGRPGLVDLASGQVGSGDAAILVERELYKADPRVVDVRIWTLDAGFAAYA